MIDLYRKVRKHSRELGIEILIEGESRDHRVTAIDTELGGRKFSSSLWPPSKTEEVLRRFHEHIYRERAKAKYEEQRGLCAHCKRKLRGQGECDHILSRGAHGRDDRLSNLAIYCARMTGGCSYHHDKHTKGK